MERKRPRTRSRSREGSPSPTRTPQLIPVRRSLHMSGAGACYEESLQKFLSMMGMLKMMTLNSESIIDDLTANLWATALNHKDMYDEESPILNPFFTPEQWELKTANMLQMVDIIMSSEDRIITQNNVDDYQLLSLSNCQCVAHTNPKGRVGEMIDIPEPLNDDSGNKLASILIPSILEKAGLADTVSFETCKSGTPYTINYILQLSNGESTSFTGWPDFSIIKRSAPIPIHRRSARLAGIGEVQSPPGITDKSKTAAIAQAGIYGVGELTRTNKVTIVVFFKDKSAVVAVSTIKPAEISLPNSLGEPSFQFVNRIDAMSLKNPAELKEFCNILIATLQYTLE